MALSPKKFPTPPILPDESPSQDNTYRFPLDQLLRLHDFKIFARPKGRPTLWIFDGKLYTQRQALLTVDPREIGDPRLLKAWRDFFNP